MAHNSWRLAVLARMLRCALSALVILFVHIISTLARLLGPGGIRSVIAESVLVLLRAGNLGKLRSVFSEFLVKSSTAATKAQ